MNNWTVFYNNSSIPKDYNFHATMTTVFSLTNFIILTVLFIIIPIILMIPIIKNQYARFLFIGNYLGIITLLSYKVFYFINYQEYLGISIGWGFLMLFIMARGHHEI